MSLFLNIFKLAELMTPSSFPVSNTLNCHGDSWYRIHLSNREKCSYLFPFSSLVLCNCRWWKEEPFCQQLLHQFPRAWSVIFNTVDTRLLTVLLSTTRLSSSFLVWNCTGATWITKIWHLKDATIVLILPWLIFMDKFTLLSNSKFWTFK